MKKKQKKLIVFSWKKQLRFFHLGREQSICELGCTHFIFQTEILPYEGLTDTVKVVCTKTMHLLLASSICNYQDKTCQTSHVVEKGPI